MKVLGNLFKGDKYLWFTVGMLMLISLLAVYSSTGTLAYKYQSGNTEYYLFKHLNILLFGLVLMYLTHRIRYTFFSRFSKIAIILAIPLLLLTLLVGTNLNDASRWLTIPIINLSFQTSDFAKLALLLFVARELSKKQENIKDFKTTFLPIMLVVLLTCGLILPANFSTAAVVFAASIVLMIIGRINLKYIAMMLGIGVVALSIFVSIAIVFDLDSGPFGRVQTWKSRVESFSNGNDEGSYQSQQAKIAIASGGIIGKGPGNSTQRNFLPHPYSDFIFAIIIEEYGFMAGLLVVGLYLVLFYRAIHIARKSPRAFATFLAIGCAFSLVFQAMINMAVAVNLFPVTGQPLPMISMGGTSTLFTSIAVGIILSVSREAEKKGGVKQVEV
jgi:cell division protein FtsW